MNTKKNIIKKPLVLDEVKESQIWDKDKMDKLRGFILSESKKQSPERKKRNELLSVKYQMQDYIAQNKIEKEMQPLDFVKLYLKLLNITQKELAFMFGMSPAHLYKYLKGDRKLNPDLVLKLSSFSNTKPELWYYIQTKNELDALGKLENIKQYEKYNYKNLVTQ